jgi:hypothetical protein
MYSSGDVLGGGRREGGGGGGGEVDVGIISKLSTLGFQYQPHGSSTKDNCHVNIAVMLSAIWHHTSSLMPLSYGL